MWHRVDKTGTCWLWQGARLKGKRPYGKTYYEGKYWYAHRLAWTLTYGPIPCGMVVCHTCDNPPCCRPTHLFLGSQRDNLRDASSKGRLDARKSPQGEKHGRAKLTWAMVHAIRHMHAQGMQHRDIATMLGMARSSIWSALTGKTWKQQTD